MWANANVVVQLLFNSNKPRSIINNHPAAKSIWKSKSATPPIVTINSQAWGGNAVWPQMSAVTHNLANETNSASGGNARSQNLISQRLRSSPQQQSESNQRGKRDLGPNNQQQNPSHLGRSQQSAPQSAARNQNNANNNLNKPPASGAGADPSVKIDSELVNVANENRVILNVGGIRHETYKVSNDWFSLVILSASQTLPPPLVSINHSRCD